MYYTLKSAQKITELKYLHIGNQSINTEVTKEGVPRDPRFVFRAFYYFRLSFFHCYFF